MITQVIMKRELFNEEVSQQSKTGYFSATELIKAGNKWRVSNGLPMINLAEFFRLEKTKEFIKELEIQTGEKVKISSKGRKSNTWVHPFLFIDLALYISPKLKIEVYSWLYDELLKYRNFSGDSYKKMTGALFENCSNKSTFTKYIQDVAKYIKNNCGVKDWNASTEEQLKLRDKMHENIALLCDVLKNNNDAVRIGVYKTKNDFL